ncbi:hypothetical protein [Compostibacter hankyongensis]|uniref:Addiction module protein n=1 Tax=Compostibacter hankyongensis TaxID=1007089 RepID=A0ABP8FH25_9BACT
MAILVSPHDEKEEKVLLAFLDSLQYRYQEMKEELTAPPELTPALKGLLDNRLKAYHTKQDNGKSWKECKNELLRDA